MYEHMESNKVASGGTAKRIGLSSHLTHTFTESGDFTVHRPVIVRYLIVGGRGGGPAPDEKTKVDQEGGIGEIIEGTSTYQLQPGTYKVTVGPRSTTFTEKGIAGVGVTTGPRINWVNPPGGGNPCPSGVACYMVDKLKHSVVWSNRTRRSYTPGNPSSIQTLASANGGRPHPGISNEPLQKYHSYITQWGLSTKVFERSGASATGYWSMDANDATWKVVPDGVATVNAYHTQQKESDITGEKQTYGLKPIVVIRYDESTVGAAPPATPSPDTIAQIEKAYAEKMQKLKDALEAEKRALESQNAAAAAEASKLKDQLFSDLTGLKAQYDQLKATVSSTTGQLDATKRDIADLKSEYDMKMAELKRAQQTELDAISTNNREAIDAARSAKETLVRELTALKVAYDTIVALSKQCPIIPEDAIVVDSKTGGMFKYEAGVLRGISAETYGALGKPKYTLFNPGALDNCPRGPDITIETVAPKPVDEPVAEPKFPSTAYVIAHAESWEMNGELRVLAARFGGVVIEPFEFKEYAQLFVINSAGYVRNLNGDGAYMTSTEKCLAPSMSKTVPRTGWKLRKTGESQYMYTLIAECGVSIKAGPSDRSAVLEKSVFGGDASDEWYVIPVGRVEF
jgi:hypothetical protein